MSNKEVNSFDQSLSILEDNTRDIDERVKEMLRHVEGTDVDPRNVLITYAAQLREDDPFDNNQRRVRSLLTAARGQGLDIDMEDVIDGAINRKGVSSGGGDSVGLDEKSRGGSVESSTLETEKTEIDNAEFAGAEDVVQYGVGIYRDDSITSAEMSELITYLVDTATDSGIDVSTADIREGIRRFSDISIDELKNPASGKSSDFGIPLDAADDPDEVRIVVEDLELSTRGVSVDEAVEVTARVTNHGSVPGERTIGLIIDGETINEESVEIDPGNTRDLDYSVKFNESGLHTIEVPDDNFKEIQVLEPSSIRVVDIDRRRFKLREGEPITVDYQVHNSGDMDGEIEVPVRLDGEKVADRTHTIPGDETVTKSVDVPVKSTGLHDLEIGQYETTIRALSPASVSVTGYDVETTGVEVGDTLGVSVTMENEGAVDGDISVALYIDDEIRRSTKVTIPGDESVTESFDISLEEPGEHKLSVNDLDETTVTALRPPSIEIVDIEPESNRIRSGERLFLTATLENSGDLEGELDIVATVDGEVQIEGPVTVQGQSERELTIGFNGDVSGSFLDALDEAGTYEVAVNDHDPVEVRVLDPADISIDRCRLDSEVIDPGEKVRLDVSCLNEGDIGGTIPIEVAVDGEHVETYEVSVEGNGNAVGNIKYPLYNPGEHTITINGGEYEYTVNVNEDQVVEILGAEPLRDGIQLGDELRIGYVVRNLTGQDLEEDIVLYEDAKPVVRETLEFGPREELDEVLSYEPDSAGVHSYRLNGVDVAQMSIDGSDSKEADDSSSEERAGTSSTSDVGDDPGASVDGEEVEMEQAASPSESETEPAQGPSPDQAEDDGSSDPSSPPFDDPAPEDGSEAAVQPQPSADGPETPDAEGGLSLSDIDGEEDGRDRGESLQESMGSGGQTKLHARKGDFGPNPRNVDSKASRTDVDDEDEFDVDEDDLERAAVEYLNLPQNTRKTVKFDYVLGSDDPFVPDGVDGAGMVVINDDHYVGMAKVQPRSWSVHTPQKRREIVNQYAQLFLSILDFKVQISIIPRDFDASDHIDSLQEMNGPGRTGDESELLTIAREIYPIWLRGFIDERNMKVRDFYLVTRVKASRVNQFGRSKTSLVGRVEEMNQTAGSALKKLVGAASRGRGGGGSKKASRKQCLVELQDRLTRMESSLQPLGVNVEPVRSRSEAMEALYTYFNNATPLNDTFDGATRAVYDPSVEYDDDHSADDLVNFDYDRFAEPLEEDLKQ